MLATINERLGVLGGYSEVVERLEQRSWTFGWKAWFLFGIVGGSLVFSLPAGSWATAEGYGWLSGAFADYAEVKVGVLLLAAGTLIG